MDVSADLELYASHREFIKIVAKMRAAHWYFFKFSMKEFIASVIFDAILGKFHKIPLRKKTISLSRLHYKLISL